MANGTVRNGPLLHIPSRHCQRYHLSIDIFSHLPTEFSPPTRMHPIYSIATTLCILSTPILISHDRYPFIDFYGRTGARGKTRRRVVVMHFDIHWLLLSPCLFLSCLGRLSSLPSLNCVRGLALIVGFVVCCSTWREWEGRSSWIVVVAG